MGFGPTRELAPPSDFQDVLSSERSPSAGLRYRLRGAPARPGHVRGVCCSVAVEGRRVRREVQHHAQVRGLVDAEGPGVDELDVLSGDLVEEITTLKNEVGGDVVVRGSAGLAQGLLEHDLADELRLMVYPVVLEAAGGSSGRDRRSGSSSPSRARSATASSSSPTGARSNPAARRRAGRRFRPMERVNGLDVPRSLEDACDPRRLALLVYDMQVGIMGNRRRPGGRSAGPGRPRSGPGRGVARIPRATETHRRYRQRHPRQLILRQRPGHSLSANRRGLIEVTGDGGAGRCFTPHRWSELGMKAVSRRRARPAAGSLARASRP